MFSPSNLVKRVGVGGGLVPFFKCVCVYFALGGGAGDAGGGPSAGAAAAKCAPVLCLLAAVLLLAPPRDGKEDTDEHKERRRYARLVSLGLGLSALGDALLVWPAQLAPGMAAFGAAHVAYGRAFRPRAPRRAAAAALALAAALFLSRLSPPPSLRLLVPLYTALLVGMSWRALATLPPVGATPRAWAAPAGALLFVLSDAILGYCLFAGRLPHQQVLVMSTYYLGQLFIALSALLPPPAPPCPPGPAACPPGPASSQESPAVAAH